MKKARGIGVITVVLAALYTLYHCSDPVREQHYDTYINHHDSVSYVGIQTCASCHADVYETFIRTGMGLSFDTARPEKSSGFFKLDALTYDTALDYYYMPYWLGRDLYFDEFRLRGRDTVHRRSEMIQYIIGSGQHTNSHLLHRNGFLFQAPLTFYTQASAWDLAPGYKNGNNSRFTRIIDNECLGCHNAVPVTDSRDERKFLQIGKGIDCERCHGPGSAHVQFRQKGGKPEGNYDPTIVNPSDLSWERQIDLCQRCHLQGNNVLKPGKAFSDFRPGMKLSEVFEIYLPKYSGDQSLFNMANHSDRLQMSQCFKGSTRGKGGKGLTCISCHNPHLSVRETNHLVFNRTCMGCHNDDCSEKALKRSELSDNCVACHMPSNTAADIPHVTVHDHRIGIYRNGKPEMGNSTVVGLYCVNNEKPGVSMQIRAYLTYFEKFEPLPIYRQKARELLDKHHFPVLELHYAFQVADWKGVLRQVPSLDLSNLDHQDAYRVAEAYFGLGKLKEAEDWFEWAVEKSPLRFEYLSRYGKVLMQAGRTEEARQILLKALELNPTYKPALDQMALVEIGSGNYLKGEYWLNRCLDLDPDYIPALEHLLELVKITGKRESALRRAENFNKRPGGSEKLNRLLKDLYAQAQ